MRYRKTVKSGKARVSAGERNALPRSSKRQNYRQAETTSVAASRRAAAAGRGGAGTGAGAEPAGTQRGVRPSCAGAAAPRAAGDSEVITKHFRQQSGGRRKERSFPRSLALRRSGVKRPRASDPGAAAASRGGAAATAAPSSSAALCRGREGTGHKPSDEKWPSRRRARGPGPSPGREASGRGPGIGANRCAGSEQEPEERDGPPRAASQGAPSAKGGQNLLTR